jgi:hypothetical protein
MSARHEQLAGWGGIPGECGVECACGTTFDGFITLAEAKAQLDHHIEHAELVAGLRELADWYQEHLEVPLAPYPEWRHIVIGNDDEAGAAEIAALAKALGVEVKTPRNIECHRQFGPITFNAFYVPAHHMQQHYADTALLKVAKAAQNSARASTPAERVTAPMPGSASPNARTTAPASLLSGEVEGGRRGPGLDAGDGQGTRPAGAGGDVPAPATTRGHPCIDVPPGVRVLGDPDYGQAKRTS